MCKRRRERIKFYISKSKSLRIKQQLTLSLSLFRVEEILIQQPKKMKKTKFFSSILSVFRQKLEISTEFLL